jgi:hypothetical protein
VQAGNLFIVVFRDDFSNNLVYSKKASTPKLQGSEAFFGGLVTIKNMIFGN